MTLTTTPFPVTCPGEQQSYPYSLLRYIAIISLAKLVPGRYHGQAHGGRLDLLLGSIPYLRWGVRGRGQW